MAALLLRRSGVRISGIRHSRCLILTGGEGRETNGRFPKGRTLLRRCALFSVPAVYEAGKKLATGNLSARGNLSNVTASMSADDPKWGDSPVIDRPYSLLCQQHGDLTDAARDDETLVEMNLQIESGINPAKLQKAPAQGASRKAGFREFREE